MIVPSGSDAINNEGVDLLDLWKDSDVGFGCHGWGSMDDGQKQVLGALKVKRSGVQ